MAYRTLLFEVNEGVARLTINRPEAANSLNGEAFREFLDAILHCDDDAAVRAVVITGAGRFFCTGGDLKSFAEQGADLPRHLKEMTTYFHAAISRMARMDAPVIAAVNGAAAGAGMSLACACDLVVAGESAKFTMAYTRAGLTPDGSGTFFLPRLVGLKRALELCLTNRTLAAEEARDWGIVTRVVPDVDVVSEAAGLAAQLAAGPTRAFGTTKRLLQGSFAASLETQMEDEAQGIAAMAKTADGREGMAAFLEKRTPAYRNA